jgi:hypothetical protein
MLHEQVGSRAPPSKRDWPASANSPRTGVRWLASLVATLPLVAEVVLFRPDREGDRRIYRAGGYADDDRVLRGQRGAMKGPWLSRMSAIVACLSPC